MGVEMNCDKIKIEWNARIDEKLHTISLIPKEKKYQYSLYIDDQFLDDLKINKWFN